MIDIIIEKILLWGAVLEGFSLKMTALDAVIIIFTIAAIIFVKYYVVKY